MKKSELIAILLGLATILIGVLAWLYPFGPVRPSIFPTSSLVWTDNFNTPTLSEHWSWIGEDTTHWSLTSRPGFMQITTSRESGGLTPINLLVQNIPATNFSIETGVIFAPQQDFHFAGLVIWRDGNNFLKLGRAYYSPSGDGLYFDRKENGEWGETDFPTDVTVSGNEEVHLRLIRQGVVYSGYVSMNGQDWILLGSHTIGFTPTHIGLWTSVGLQDVPEIPADFDYFTFMEK
jgi:beta-xylosidase